RNTFHVGRSYGNASASTIPTGFTQCAALAAATPCNVLRVTCNSKARNSKRSPERLHLIHPLPGKRRRRLFLPAAVVLPAVGVVERVAAEVAVAGGGLVDGVEQVEHL